MVATRRSTGLSCRPSTTSPAVHHIRTPAGFSSSTARLLSYHGPWVTSHASGGGGTRAGLGQATPHHAQGPARRTGGDRVHELGQRVADRRAHRLQDPARDLGTPLSRRRDRLGDVAVVHVAGEEGHRRRARVPAPRPRPPGSSRRPRPEAASRRPPQCSRSTAWRSPLPQARDPAPPGTLGQRLAERLAVVQPRRHEERQRGPEQQVVDVAAHLLVEPVHLPVVEDRARSSGSQHAGRARVDHDQAGLGVEVAGEAPAVGLRLAGRRGPRSSSSSAVTSSSPSPSCDAIRCHIGSSARACGPRLPRCW